MSPPDAGAPPRPISTLAPFRIAFFRAIWLASLFSNIGTWVQSVGAAWAMTTIAPSADMVALVQAASTAPLLIFSLLAGAVADMWDRRIVMLVSLAWMLIAAATLATLEYFGLTSPWVLLLLTFMLGSGQAIYGPAWQASVGDMVPREMLPTAVALNSMGFNMARSVGPAIGGLIVAAAGPEAAFLLNAVSFIAVIVVVFSWDRPVTVRRLPREALGAALRAGLRYVGQSPDIQNVLARATIFGVAASGTWALLPVIAKQDLGGGPLTYGLMLTALGAGAVAGGTTLTRLRSWLGNEAMVSAAMAAFALATIVLSAVAWIPAVMAALVIAGASWLITLSTFNVTVQITASNWVKARALSIYTTCAFGGMAIGSWVWGNVAESSGTPMALAASAVLMAAGLLLRHRYRLPPLGRIDNRPAREWPEPKPAFEFDRISKPVMITVEYRVDPGRAEPFVRAMRGLRRIRKRDGATRWGLYQDVENPQRWVETFMVASWVEHLRQHSRGIAADQAVEDRVRGFLCEGTAPRISHMVMHDPTQATAISRTDVAPM